MADQSAKRKTAFFNVDFAKSQQAELKIQPIQHLGNSSQSWNCRTSTGSSRSERALPDLNHELQISVGTAGPQPWGTAGLQPWAPNLSGNCQTSTASARSQWARQNRCRMERRKKCRLLYFEWFPPWHFKAFRALVQPSVSLGWNAVAIYAISYDILSGICIWHIFWHSIWHIFGDFLWLRSGGEHSDPELAVEVPLRSKACKWGPMGSLWSRGCCSCPAGKIAI